MNKIKKKNKYKVNLKRIMKIIIVDIMINLKKMIINIIKVIVTIIIIIIIEVVAIHLLKKKINNKKAEVEVKINNIIKLIKSLKKIKIN